MFRILDQQDIVAKTIPHGQNVFHEALEDGGTYYHVTGAPYGDYDIAYIKNNDTVPENYRKNKPGIDIYPSYLHYDEYDEKTMDLSLIKSRRAVFFETIDEYAAVLAGVVLRYTEAAVYFRSPIICNFAAMREFRRSEAARSIIDSGDAAGVFYDREDRVIITEHFPEMPKGEALFVTDGFLTGILEQDFDRVSSVAAFHSLFFLQALTDLPPENIRFAEVGVTKSVGIGGLLSYYGSACRMFGAYGWKTYLREGASRYPDGMLRRYFDISAKPPEANAENTVFVEDITTLSLTYFGFTHPSETDEGILAPAFRAEMDEYADAVLGGHRVLGVLIRGTDYIVSNMGGARQMATVGDMAPLIREWMREDGYDRIFLATEDLDVLDAMREEFGESVIAISQIRHRVSDFVNVRLLSDLEAEENKGMNAEELLEDNTVNYFYALYILSRCDSFMASGACHGTTVVRAFHHGPFRREFIFRVGLDRS